MTTLLADEITTDAQDGEHVLDADDVQGNWLLLTTAMRSARNYVTIMDWVGRHPGREETDVRMLFVTSLHERAFSEDNGAGLLLNPSAMAALMMDCRERVGSEQPGNEWTASDEQRARRKQAGHDLVEFVRSAHAVHLCGGSWLDGGQRAYILRLQQLEAAAENRPDDDHYKSGRVFCGLDNNGQPLNPSLFPGCWDLFPMQYHKRAMRLQDLPNGYVEWVMDRMSADDIRMA